MTASKLPPASHTTRFAWLNHRPYLLLSLTSLFWAGNIVLGRSAVVIASRRSSAA
jgi:hypothetical protein